MKKIISITAIFMALMISCTKVDVADNNTNPLPMPEKAQVAVQGLGVTPKANYVVVGEPVQLEVSVSPEEAVAGTVSWTSSDPTVATVDAEGKVTTLSVGIARITASVEGASATAIVNVFAERIPATEIKLNKTEVTLLVGRATQVRASLLPDGSVEGEPGTTDQLDLEWTSSNENVAIVNYGFIQAIGMGEAVITAKQGDLTATVNVTVADKIKLVDRSEAWTITDTPKWDKNWSGQISGSHVDVALAGCDAEMHYFKVVSADKFTNIEALSNDVYTAVEDAKDAGKDPKSLFKSGENETVKYSEKGDAVAFVLGIDSECEFTGEYAVYNFVGREPDPVHATGIAFYQGSWNATLISSLELKEGKNAILQLRFLPDDCTDTGTITLEAADPGILSISAYYPSYYSNYYQVTGAAAGTTKLLAKYNNVVSELPVTVSGGGIVWTDCSSSWTGHFGEVENWGNKYFGYILETCTSPNHYMFMESASEVGSDPVAYMKSTAAQAEDWLSYYSSSTLPDKTYAYSGSDQDEFYAFVVGVDASGASFDGKYAIYHHDPNAGSGGDQPGGGAEGAEGKIVSFDTQGQYIPVTWKDADASQDNITLEGWFNPSSLGGSGDAALHCLMGVEGYLLLRFDGSKLQLNYASGESYKNDKNEYEATNLDATTSFQTGTWYHIAATYSKGGKVKLYVNGEEVGSADAPKNHGLSLNGSTAQYELPFKFYIGAAAQPKRYFAGSMYELRVWSVARTADEIKNNKDKHVTSGTGLLASWAFSDGSGNTVADKSGNGYNITSNGTLKWENGTLPF